MAAARTPAEHASLVAALQQEYFADDLNPPADAIAWCESDVVAFFEAGGPAVSSPIADQFDLIIPFGEFCGVATIMQALDARSASYPFDWVYSSLPLLLNFLATDCAPESILSHPSNLRHVLPPSRTAPAVHEWQYATGAHADAISADHAELEAWPVDSTREQPTTESINEGDGLQAGCHVRDMVTGAIFPHDFGPGALEPQFEAVHAKYRRRCARLRAALQGKAVLLLHVRNGYLSGEASPHAARDLDELERVLRRWPRVRCECWNVLDEPREQLLDLGRTRHLVQPLLHAPNGQRDKHLWIVLGLRLIELDAVGPAGQAAKAAIVVGAKNLVHSIEHQPPPPPVVLKPRPRDEMAVISLEHRTDRRDAFFRAWKGPHPRMARAVDGRTLRERRDVPLAPADLRAASPGVRALLADWRRSMCEHDRAWGGKQPRKFAAVAACHCSHLLLWDALCQSGNDDEVLFVLEDDAALPNVSDDAPLCTWFATHVAPQLPDDWAFCYLNEPLKLIEAGGARARRAASAWRVVRVEDDDAHPAARCVRDVDGVPATEAYALRRSAAARLVAFSAAHGLGAVDYVIAKAFASPAALAAFPVASPYLDLLGPPRAEEQGVQRPAWSSPTDAARMAGRVYLVDPPIAHQAVGSTIDSDIQNFLLVGEQEMHLTEMFGSVPPGSR